MDSRHLAVAMKEACERYAGRNATRVRVGERWQTQTFRQFGLRIDALSQRLVDAGVQPGDRVVIFSTNRPAWHEADFAIMGVRGVVVPIYPSSTPEQVLHIARDSGAVLAFVEGASEVGRLQQVWPELPELRLAVAFDTVTTDDERVTSLDAFLSAPASDDAAAEVRARLDAASGDDDASIIYTSGTTGDPRGAVLTHRGFTSELADLKALFDLGPDDHSLCFLPLSHALERGWSAFIMTNGCMNTYTDAHQVAEMLVLAQPTLLVSVPRLYEKIVATARKKVDKSQVKRALFEWALRVGGQNQRAYRKGRRPALWWRAQLGLADKLVLSSVRDAIGGPKTVMASGGAPIRQDVEEFFSACGVPLVTGYGLTEASPLVSFNSYSDFKIGTVGKVVQSGELKIGTESEILFRAPNVMRGYWNDPEKTAEAIDAEGWLHTGDVGYIDNDGFLVITDRIKDLIVTSNGKNIAPAPIEGMLLADPLFEQAVILGDNRPFLTLLVTPSMPQLEELAAKLHVTASDRESLLSHPAIIDEVRQRVTAVTGKLARHEQIKDLRIMFEEFTQENGLLTPTLKVRRREVERRFKEVIDDMYAKVAERRSQD